MNVTQMITWSAISEIFRQRELIFVTWRGIPTSISLVRESRIVRVLILLRRGTLDFAQRSTRSWVPPNASQQRNACRQSATDLLSRHSSTKLTSHPKTVT